VVETSLANSHSRKNELKRIIKSNGKIAIEKIPFIKRENNYQFSGRIFFIGKNYKNVLVFKKNKIIGLVLFRWFLLLYYVILIFAFP